MPFSAIHQMHHTAAIGDAIGGSLLSLQELLQELGYDSDIYAEFIHPDLFKSGRVKPYPHYKSRPDQLLIHHFSIASKTVVPFVLGLHDPKILYYHNMTPPQFWRGVNARIYSDLELGRSQFKQMAERPGAYRLAVGVSEFNRTDLERAGFAPTATLPIPFTALGAEPDKGIVKRYSDGVLNMLFVGRLAQNKRFEDVLKVFAVLHHKLVPKSRLLLVGTHADAEPYLDALLELARALKIEGAVEFTGHVSAARLAAYYRVAQAFVCMSEHEGFCVPLLEAMAADIPVYAYAAAAVPETLGSAGLLFREREYALIAEAIYATQQNPAFRRTLVAGQRKRLADYHRSRVKEQLKALIAQVE